MPVPLAPLFGDRRARILLLAAHPDDETIGAGALLNRLLDSDGTIAVAHLTDGAPAGDDEARAHGFDMNEDYACARRAELARALALLPREPEQFALPFQDQALSSRLLDVVSTLARLIQWWSPTVVFTHPYEGGHPDHDSAALALAVVSSLLACAPSRLEFTSYHLHDGEIRTGVFLDTDGGTVTSFPLDRDAVETKQQMLERFVTQQSSLRWFDPSRPELFRPAPAYDFRRPPHAPPLFYDLFPWGTNSSEWLSRAGALLDATGDGSLPCR